MSSKSITNFFFFVFFLEPQAEYLTLSIVVCLGDMEEGVYTRQGVKLSPVRHTVDNARGAGRGGHLSGLQNIE